MFPRLHFTKFLLFSLALHALVVAAALFLIKPEATLLPTTTPVNIVNLPPQEVKQLPPLRRPAPARPVPPPPSVPKSMVPERPLPPEAVPMPKKFGESEELKLPKTSPPTGVPEGAEQGAATGKTGLAPDQTQSGETGKTGPAQSRKQAGPLPFLTQNDIEQYARKGMPDKQPGDNSVTLDTDEFKFISYNRWLKAKIESVLKYPELAAMSGYQGTLYIKFDILKDGSLGGIDVLKSSGYRILDDEAVRAVRASAPFQPLPDDWSMDRYSIRAAVIFYMNTGYIR